MLSAPGLFQQILIEGAHTIQQQADVSTRVISECVTALWRQPGIVLEGLLLKPQMAIPGCDAPGGPPSPSNVAHHTLAMMRRYKPFRRLGAPGGPPSPSDVAHHTPAMMRRYRTLY